MPATAKGGKVRKFCSQKCSHKEQKGKKKPHSPEWEANRLAAIKMSAKIRIYPKGWKHTEEAKKKMSVSIKAAIKLNPEKTREIAIANLPKDVYGEKNGNWRGGKTKLSKDYMTANCKKYYRWRKFILKRDDSKCKLCDSSEKLEVHHIIPMSETRLTAFLPMNGITLCLECHKKTDSFGGKVRVNKRIEDGTGKTQCLARTIPHEYQVYDTIGNWAYTDEGLLVIFISDLGNDIYEQFIFVHEYIEAMLCKLRGITCEQVDEWDIHTFKGDGEPGDDPLCPYHKEHVFASKVERMVADEMGVDWHSYNDFLSKFNPKENDYE